MNVNEGKKRLSVQDLHKAREIKHDTAPEFLHPRNLQANVVGMGVGMKWKANKPTGEPAVTVFVTHKVGKEQLSKADVVPAKIDDMQTDVVPIGHPVIQAMRAKETERIGIRQSDSRNLAERMRPARGGCSIGHKDITAGTIATCAYDILSGGSTNPPEPGVGMPSKFYILSNNHVLANSNEASEGDPILQPGPHDGGEDPEDRIGILTRFVPIDLDPPTPREDHHNLVDAAIAEANFTDIDREIHWSGRVRGWRRKDDVEVGTIIRKVGRTSGYTTGRITAVDATVDVGFGGGRIARFEEQIITTHFSEGGDSGSLITTLDNVAVGLLFAGSNRATICNQIENVRSLLQIEIAEEIL